MRIIFMGTPDFAVASLQKLVENKHNIVAVVTAPDKPAGRGRKIQYSAVKQYALENHLPILQPSNLKDPGFIEELSSLNPDLQVVVAFRMLPKIVWELPTKGTINLHASLLPQYRGAAPINWAIINGEKLTGVTTFFINENIDTGAIIMQAEEPITNQDNAGSLHDKLMTTGAGLLLKTVELIEKGAAPHKEQNVTGTAKHAPKIFKEDTLINFNRPAQEVFNFIRGLSPYPTAHSFLKMQGQDVLAVKIFDCNITEEPSSGEAGKLKTDNKNFLHINCSDKELSVKILQIAGKKRMDVKGFLNGFKIAENARMG